MRKRQFTTGLVLAGGWAAGGGVIGQALQEADHAIFVIGEPRKTIEVFGNLRFMASHISVVQVRLNESRNERRRSLIVSDQFREPVDREITLRPCGIECAQGLPDRIRLADGASRDQDTFHGSILVPRLRVSKEFERSLRTRCTFRTVQ